MTEQTLTLDRLRADVAAMLGTDPSEVGDDDNLMDIGLDSMRTMNLVMQWEEAGLPIEFPDLAETMTLAGLWGIVSERL
ncbi:phosphopantetheine-binding protein [Sphingomonas flavalba]|uniref:phosphopantetheine-binding protein n=1 Tax=Sphingomonas flavalba TaxID=2559804 RepID=UPI0039E1B965